MNEPLISIVVPNYNHARFLRQRWESIINQTYQNFEIILLDDCSKDDSRTLLEEFAKHKKVSCYIENKENSGSPFKQWKLGIEQCRGEYIWIAESDDWASNCFLEKLIGGMSDNVVLAFAGSRHVDTNGNELAVTDNTLNEQARLISGTDFIKRQMQDGNGIPNASAVLFRRSELLLDKIPANMRYCGDWVFWINVLQYGDLYFLPEKLNSFRCHVDSTRKTSNENIRFINTIDRPEYMKEYVDGAVAAYRALGLKWSPTSFYEILRLGKELGKKYPGFGIFKGVPLSMWSTLYADHFLRATGLYRAASRCASLFRLLASLFLVGGGVV